MKKIILLAMLALTGTAHADPPQQSCGLDAESCVILACVAKHPLRGQMSEHDLPISEWDRQIRNIVLHDCGMPDSALWKKEDVHR